MFQDDINRKINGVIKVNQDDLDVIKQEVREYVITRELKKHFMTFFNYYCEMFDNPNADIGVWLSGFFGSGKSHLLKMLSYILENKEIDGETVMCFSKGTYPHRSVKVEFPLEGLNVAQLQGNATYEQIKAYVLEHSGLKVSTLYIAQIKQKFGIIERECYNKPKSEDAKQPQCPPDKEAAIVEALKFYGLIAP
jgi:hypothetical protein